MEKVSLTEVYDPDGNMVRIEAYRTDTGEHVIDALWDPTDEQTKENHIEFRKWFNTMLARKGYETAK